MQAPITIKSGQPRLKCIHAHIWKTLLKKIAKINIYVRRLKDSKTQLRLKNPRNGVRESFFS